MADSSETYFCNGEEWISVKGADGKDGAKGDKGDKGDSGKDGETTAKVDTINIILRDTVFKRDTIVLNKKDTVVIENKGLDGKSCSAKKVTKGNLSGLELTCGEAVIDTIWNGVDGTPGGKGDDGTSCTAAKVSKDGRNGVELTCNGTVIDTIWSGINGTPGKSGTNCAASTVEKDGRKGIELTCGGDVVDTVWNGLDGKNAVACKKNVDADGVVIHICGIGDEIDSIKTYDTECGGILYNPKSALCKENILYSCEGLAYDPDTALCKENILYSCGGMPYDPDTALCKENILYSCEGLAYNPDTALCKENILYSCAGIPYDPNMVYCKDTKTITPYGHLFYDGQDYKTVVIGSQTWMAENLNYWDTLKTPNLIEASRCGGPSKDCSVYGRAYTWAAAIDQPENVCGEGKNCPLSGVVQGICPDGWHLPDTTEFNILLTAAGDKDVAGAILRSSSGWIYSDEKNCNGTNAFGFSALPTGNVYWGGGDTTYQASFWSSDEPYALKFLDENCSDHAKFENYSKTSFYSVRCIKNN